MQGGGGRPPLLEHLQSRLEEGTGLLPLQVNKHGVTTGACRDVSICMHVVGIVYHVTRFMCDGLYVCMFLGLGERCKGGGYIQGFGSVCLDNCVGML